MTSISFTAHGVTISAYTLAEDLTCGEVVEGLVRPMLKAAGYHEATIKRTLGDVDERALSDFATVVERANADA